MTLLTITKDTLEHNTISISILKHCHYGSGKCLEYFVCLLSSSPLIWRHKLKSVFLKRPTAETSAFQWLMLWLSRMLTGEMGAHLRVWDPSLQPASRSRWASWGWRRGCPLAWPRGARPPSTRGCFRIASCRILCCGTELHPAGKDKRPNEKKKKSINA